MSGLSFSLLLLVFLLSTLGCRCLIYLAYRFNHFDKPNARSSHTIPTPHGGGIAIASAFCVGLFFSGIDGITVVSLAIGITLLVIVGAIDDYRGLAVKWRLLAQVAACVWGVHCFDTHWFSLPQGLLGGALALFEHISIIITLVWLVNLYNFMDGIDGLAASETIFITISMAWFVGFGTPLGVLMLLLCAASLGFLVFNWAPAKLFMGDSGSYVMGYSLGIAGCMAIEQQTAFSPWVLCILLAVFIIDATYTLGHRVLQGAIWYHPHRSHAYQKTARYLRSHAKTTALIQIINIAWLLPCAYFVLQQPKWSFFIVFVAFLPLILLVSALKAGSPD